MKIIDIRYTSLSEPLYFSKLPRFDFKNKTFKFLYWIINWS